MVLCRTREWMRCFLRQESQLAQALSTSNDWCLRLSKESSAKQQLEEDVSSLKL